MVRGRPREFDPDDALEKAMRVFWEKGASGASMADLEAATDLAKPSLYACFGDKNALFAKALGRYHEEFGDPALRELACTAVPVDVALRRHLEAVADFVSDPDRPGGCFLVNCIIDRSNRPEAVQRIIEDVQRQQHDALAALLTRARDAGVVHGTCDVEALADFYAGQIAALAIMGRSGRDRSDMQRFIDTAMQALPLQQTGA